MRKIDLIFDFLKYNRIYNYKVQEKSYQTFLTPHKTIEDKVYSLLFHIANTQSQPKIDNLANFYQKINGSIEQLNSFKNFIDLIKPHNDITYNYDGLYKSMMEQNGWGKKTAALFTKTIYHLHNGNYKSEFKLWNDIPNKIIDTDDFYLPVDAVIISVFSKIAPETNWNFEKINAELKKHYKPNDIEIWDDLWFWGFITQKGSGTDRDFEWNNNKYWALLETDKDSESIKIIKTKANQFLDILK